jgi:hypothetical protein
MGLVVVGFGLLDITFWFLLFNASAIAGLDLVDDHRPSC